jgi:hypothetical protein
MSSVPKSRPDNLTEEQRQRFRELAQTWVEETAFFSSTWQTVGHPAFQELVGMGEAVIPLVLAEMDKGEAHWFLVLGQITGARPFRPEDQGKIRQIEEAWRRWAREQGYTW